LYIFVTETQFTLATFISFTLCVGKSRALWFPLHQTRKYNTETKGQILYLYLFCFKYCFCYRN